MLTPYHDDDEEVESKEDEDELDPGNVVNNVTLQEIEANETQFKDPHIENLYKWLRDGHRPDKCERKPMETFVYWSSYHPYTRQPIVPIQASKPTHYLGYFGPTAGYGKSFRLYPGNHLPFLEIC
ncbi:hypothetical protein BpHYR1_015713 [Brachionus plicatilis]|uniref:Uncharacterized protein n=1 Tax=Brachionus plicatilis TaxID=10195 RepID=A0A3M7Q361_BRAPC|nr:hypothetical protein BpHYR1_015713 [Brachionus plicatilis]